MSAGDASAAVDRQPESGATPSGAAARRLLRPPYRFGMPLAAKELVEQGSRRQTFVLRNGYALALLLVVLVFYQTRFLSGESLAAMLGQGEDLLGLLMTVQLGAVFLFAPIFVSDAIVGESERGAMPLLLLTGMRPSEVLIGKLAGRLAPVGVLLCLSLPFAVVAYAYGGVSAERLEVSVVHLACASVYAGAVALCCSTLLRSTAAALVATYVVLGALAGAGALASWALSALGVGVDSDVDTLLRTALAPTALLSGARPPGLAAGVRAALPYAAAALVFLVASRLAFALRYDALAGGERSARSPGLAALLRRVFRALRLAPRAAWPAADDAVRWRDLRRLGLDSPVARLGAHTGMAVLAAGAVAVVVVLGTSALAQLGILARVVAGLWLVSLALAIAGGTAAFAGERRAGTLGALLATPLPTEAIVAQKAAALRRALGVLRTPLLVTLGAMAWLAFDGGAVALWRGVALAAVAAACALTIELHVLSATWTALERGARVEGRGVGLARCALSALALALLPAITWPLLALWRHVLLPERLPLAHTLRTAYHVLTASLVIWWVLTLAGGSLSLTGPTAVQAAVFASPVSVASSLLDAFAHGGAPPRAGCLVAGTLACLAIHAALAWSRRAHCVTTADAALGRM